MLLHGRLFPPKNLESPENEFVMAHKNKWLLKENRCLWVWWENVTISLLFSSHGRSGTGTSKTKHYTKYLLKSESGFFSGDRGSRKDLVGNQVNVRSQNNVVSKDDLD